MLKPSLQIAVIRVGDGRGFVIAPKRNRDGRRFVVTAAHCLPQLPPAMSFSRYERTYKNLLAPLSEEPSVWAECVFVDPVADIAVLGAPDEQELFEQAAAFEQLVQSTTSMAVADVASESMTGWLLPLEGPWFKCTVEHFGGALWIEDATEGIVGGMSGSPILADNSSAVGVMTTGNGPFGPQPRLVHCLPGWLLGELGWPHAKRQARVSGAGPGVGHKVL